MWGMSGWECHSARNETSSNRFNCSICTAYGGIRERKRGRTKEVSLFEFQSPSLFEQAEFACLVFSRSPGAGWGRVGWMEIVIFMVLWVWLLWEQDFSHQGSLTAQVTHLTPGHKITLCSPTHTNVRFLFHYELISFQTYLHQYKEIYMINILM